MTTQDIVAPGSLLVNCHLPHGSFVNTRLETARPDEEAHTRPWFERYHRGTANACISAAVADHYGEVVAGNVPIQIPGHHVEMGSTAYLLRETSRASIEPLLT